MSFFNAGLQIPSSNDLVLADSNASIKFTGDAGQEVTIVANTTATDANNYNLVLPENAGVQSQAITISGVNGSNLTLGFSDVTNLGDSSNTNILFNDNDATNGTAQFTFDKSSNLVTISGNGTELSESGLGGALRLDNGGLYVAGNTWVNEHLFIKDDILPKATVGTVELGSATEQFGNLYIGAGSSIILGSNSNITLSHVDNVATLSSDFVVSGNLTVSGTTTTVESTVTTIEDPVLQLGNSTTTTTDAFDRGLVGRYAESSTNKSLFIGWDRQEDVFTFFKDATITNNNASGTTSSAKFANITATGTLDVTGISTLSANTSVGGNLAVTDATTLSSTLDVTGITTLSANTSVEGNLAVTGKTTLNNIAEITATDASFSTTTGALVVGGGVGIGGTLSVGGSLSVTSSTSFSNTVSMFNSTTIYGNTTLYGSLGFSSSQISSSNTTTNPNDVQLISSTSCSSVKHIIPTLNTTCYFNCNAAVSDGDLIHIFYSANTGNTSAQGVVEFGNASNLYTGSGKAPNGKLIFTTPGQSATLIYLYAPFGVDGISDGWRIINTGATVS
jgi:hypothetical protein